LATNARCFEGETDGGEHDEQKKLQVKLRTAMLVGAAVTTLTGTIYLQASRPSAPTGQKSLPTLSTIGFAILDVIAVVLIGFFLTHH
jgi:hypothetical protein